MIPKTIEVKVDGKKYMTKIYPDGHQRFIPNSLYQNLVNERIVDIDRLSDLYKLKKFPKPEYLDFICGLGYSVHGFIEKFGDDLIIENPFEN